MNAIQRVTPCYFMATVRIIYLYVPCPTLWVPRCACTHGALCHCQLTHRLAMQTQVVSEAVDALLALDASSAIDFELLSFLSHSAPQECARLLATIPLEPVALDDNIMPIVVPPGFSAVAASSKPPQEFGRRLGGAQDEKYFCDQRTEDVSVEASLMALPMTWLVLLPFSVRALCA